MLSEVMQASSVEYSNQEMLVYLFCWLAYLFLLARLFIYNGQDIKEEVRVKNNRNKGESSRE